MYRKSNPRGSVPHPPSRCALRRGRLILWTFSRVHRMLCHYVRTVLVGILLTASIACATTPPPAPVVIPFETKMSWIIRLEDQRILRDPALPIAPPPLTQARRNVVPAPPPPPDLIRLLEDTEARIRRRAALAAGRVGLPDAVPALIRLLQTDTDAEVRQMAA